MAGAPRVTPDPLASTLLLVGAVTALRALALFVSPLELYPDEAQYWLWSRELAWGYYSKPPMIGWLIAASTGIGGDAEAWVRLPATLCQAGAALAVYAAGARLYDRWSGFWAAALYTLMPGVQLSALVMSTDAPLMLFLALALAAYVGLWRGAAERRLVWAAAFGGALGLAFLSKYAALYFVGGAVLHAALSPEMRRRWPPVALVAAAAMFALVIAPNLLWNATHGFATVAHTAAETNWDDPDLFDVTQLLEFLGAQAGVFGPAPFVALVGGGIAFARRRRLGEEDRGLLLFTALPVAVVAVQAFVSGANANWAAAAYVAGSVLVGAWLVRWRSRLLAGASAGLQGALGAVFLAAAASPAVAGALGLDNGFKRARGWSATAEAVARRVQAGPGWSAVATDNRFLFNALAYYGRDVFGRPGSPPLTIWVRKAGPENQAETTAPLTAAAGGRVLVVSIVPDYRPLMARDFQGWRFLGAEEPRLDRKRTREVAFFAASGYRPAPRDPVTGLPRGS